MKTIEIFSIISSIATALGVVFVAWQLWLSKKQSQAQFEDSFDQQYRNLSLPIPVDVFLGKGMTDENRSDVRELLFNYFNLCNEQIYLGSCVRTPKFVYFRFFWNRGLKSNKGIQRFI